MNTHLLHHPSLGPLEGIPIGSDLVQFRGIPYASIAQRFARSKPLTSRLSPADHALPFDATKTGASSIQPLGSAKTDADGNQLPSEGLEDEAQNEDCLNITITVPTSALSSGSDRSDGKSKPLPTVVFLHGGAFFIGAGTRGYYTPYSFVRTAIAQNTPLILVSANYRLGALGFFHSPSTVLMPSNNGLQDQLRALEWVQRNVAGFGGDAENVTVLGQSAGAESVALHSASALGRGLYRRSVVLSGSSVTMPAMTPEEHEENFRKQAKELGIETEGQNSEQIAEDMIKLPVDKMRDLSFVGAPCSQSEAMPEERPSMRANREGKAGKREEMGQWLESQVVSAATYDGSISFIMTRNDEERKQHARAIRQIAVDVLGNEHAQELLDIYGIKDEGVESEDDALKRICQFESDIGFFAGALSIAVGSASTAERKRTKTYFQLFDLGNPFEGPLEQGKRASHTWDVVALLGAYDEKVKKIEEAAKDAKYQPYSTVLHWRKRLIKYMVCGEAPWAEWKSSALAADSAKGNSGLDRVEERIGKGTQGVAMVVRNDGMSEQDEGIYMNEDGARRRRLLELAEKQAGADGWDVLWTDVCRRFLMAGK